MDADTGDGNIVVSGRFEQLAAHSGDGNIELTVENGSRMTGRGTFAPATAASACACRVTSALTWTRTRERQD